MRAVVVGTGPGSDRSERSSIGYEHARAYQRAGIEVAGGVALSPDSVERFQEQFGAKASSTDLAHTLELAQPDVVSIATFPDSHREIVEQCTLAGVRGIWCEKPFALSLADAQDMVQRCERAGVRLVVNHVRRYFDGVRYARELLRSGDLGHPLTVTALGPAWDLLGWGTHWIDTIRALLDDEPAEWVMAQVHVSRNRWYGASDHRYGSPVEDAGILYIGFESGSRGLVESGRPPGEPGVLQCVGSGGVLELSDGRGVRILTASGVRMRAVRAAVLGPERGHALAQFFDEALGDLLSWIDGGAEPVIGPSNAFATTEIMLAGYESAVRSDRVDLPFIPLCPGFPLDLVAGRQHSGTVS